MRPRTPEKGRCSVITDSVPGTVQALKSCGEEGKQVAGIVMKKKGVGRQVSHSDLQYAKVLAAQGERAM